MTAPRIRMRVKPALIPRQAELQNSGTALQWRLAGGEWEDLILVSELPEGPQGETGPQGPQGVTGPQGPQGATGPAGSGSGDMLKSENLSGLSNYTTARSNLGLAIGTNVQAYDSDLAAIAALTTQAYGRSLLEVANEAALKTLINAEAGVDFLAFDARVQSIATIGDPNADRILFWDDSAGAYAALSLAAGLEISGTTLRQYETIIIPVSDETTTITAGTGKMTFRMPFAMTLTAVRASLNTVSSSGNPTFDINENGTTILSTKLSIDANEKTSTTAATAAVISDTALADDAEITIDIDVAGTGAKGAKIMLIGYRP